MKISKIIASIPEEEKTPLVLQLIEVIQLQQEQIQALKDEIARLKGQKPRPKIKPSKLEAAKKIKQSKTSAKRPGSVKRKKTKSIEIHDEQVIEPDNLPEGSRFKGYQDFVVQDLNICPFNTCYRLASWETPDGKYISGKPPEELSGGHFGPNLISFILYQYHHCHVTQPLILEQLLEIGIDISAGKVNQILVENKDKFHKEKDDILKVGVEVSKFLQADDTTARHDGKNGFCTHIGNEFFAFFQSTESKSRINFLEILRCGFEDYAINEHATHYMLIQRLPLKYIDQLTTMPDTIFANEQQWLEHLSKVGITSAHYIKIATEGALIGSLIEHGFNPETTIVSDDAGQFNVFVHALCWIHAERTIAKLVGFSDCQRKALDDKRSQIWNFYMDLKSYKQDPSEADSADLESRFDEIFKEKTCFATLNQALARLYRNKNELLLVLERPEIPIHNNLSERDIREYVKKRKISGSTRSQAGRRCRDTFASLKKTCRKLGISFWQYLLDRTGASKKSVPYLSDFIRECASQEST